MSSDEAGIATSPQDSVEDGISAVLDKLAEIVKAASVGSFVFRGEPKCYEEISSSLFRVYRKRLGRFGIQDFDIIHIQEEVLKEASKYAEDLTREDLLSQLQHYGYPTNLIDFTSDFLIALFFACSSELDHDGRIVLLNSDNVNLYRMRTPVNRIRSQKSVFANPPSGTITPDHVVDIPRRLKIPFLEYLRDNHDITIITVFNDIHGFMTNTKMHQSAYEEFYIGESYLFRGKLSEALEHFNTSIELNPLQPSSYVNRGIVFFMSEKYKEAIQDYTQAIDRSIEPGEIYFRRGLTFLESGVPELAVPDFSEAIRLGERVEESLEYRAQAQFRLHEYDAALEDANCSISLNPERSTSYKMRALIEWETANYEAARQDFDTSIKLDPSYEDAYLNQAGVFFDVGDYEGAIPYLTKCISICVYDGDIAEAYFRRGAALISLKRLSEARADLEKALALEPSVAKRIFETEDHVSDFLQGLGLDGEVPDKLLSMLMPREHG